MRNTHSSDEGGLRLNSTLVCRFVCVFIFFSTEISPLSVEKNSTNKYKSTSSNIYACKRSWNTFFSRFHCRSLSLIYVVLLSNSLVCSSLLEKRWKTTRKKNSSLVKRSYNSLNSIVIKCTYLMIFSSSSFHQTKRVEGEWWKKYKFSEIHIFHFN